MNLGINLSFAVKRWPEPAVWSRLVREELGLTLVQFTLDLLDPWWPEPGRGELANQARRAADDYGLTIVSAQFGLAWYAYNGLLHPDPLGRAIALEWWRRAVETAAALGAPAVGGPLGALSVAEAADPALRERRYAELLEAVVAVSEAAKAAGLSALLVEPTPLPREVPHTVDQSRRLVADLRGRTAVEIRWVLDVGHALYRPLYGAEVTMEEWLGPLQDDVGMIHLQNHDFESDAHWGWPEPRGRFDVAALARTLQATGLVDVPIVIELFFPFEAADDAVLAQTVSTVRHCAAGLDPASAGGWEEWII